MFQRCCLYCTAVVLAFTLVACSGYTKKWNPNDYTVKSGDTVYSIAWRYEVDPEQFADWNNLGRNNLIKPGQRLHTRKPRNFVSSRKSEATYSGKLVYAPKQKSSYKPPDKSYTNQIYVKAAKGDSLHRISKKTGVSVDRLIQLNQLKRPYVIQPGQVIFLKPLKTAKALPSKTLNKATKKKTQAIPWPKTVRWKRPVKGKVVKKFNARRNDAKGIEFKGKSGETVVASADGKVVYSGNGLISYGNLVIIKHNKTYLSAYAYNRKLSVSEGDVVKAGQKIAEMGYKEKKKPRLHFEIRKNGKPVNPLKYLPK